MRQKINPSVNPDEVKNSCVALIEALATNSAISDDQMVPLLADQKAEMLLPMSCVTHLWAADCLARLVGLGPNVDLKECLRRLVSALPVSVEELKRLALAEDETSALFLATAQDALRMLDMAIEKKLAALRIGKQYVDYRKTGSEECLEQILKNISPNPSYYRFKSDDDADRKHDIRVGFFDFVGKLRKIPVGDWKEFPHTVISDHRPPPHPAWDGAAKEFFVEEIQSTLSDDLPVLNHRLEAAPLEMRTLTREKLRKWFGTTTVRDDTGRAKRRLRRELDLELYSRKKEDGTSRKMSYDEQLELVRLPERKGEAAFEEQLHLLRAERKFKMLKTLDPRMYQALIDANINLSAAAKIYGMTPQGFTKRLRKLLNKTMG